MRYFNQLAAVIVIATLVLPPAPLIAGTRKGDKLRNQARVEEVHNNLEKALELTTQAVAEDPADPSYNLQLHRIRFELGVQHLKNGQKLRTSGKLAEALAEFEKALAADPASDVAEQEIRRTHEMIDNANNPGRASSQDRTGMTPGAIARQEAQVRTDALLAVPILRPLNHELIDLKIVNRPRTIFETLAPIAGINIIFDPDYNSQQTMASTPVQIDLKNTTVEAALDQICLQTKSFWKPLNPNTIFVSVDNRQNRTQYTEKVLKVFYLSNTTTPQEVSELLTVLRTVINVQQVFNYTGQNALVVRADADQMALAEKLIADLDKPHAEVIVDVMVMQVSSTYIRNLGMGLANGINSTVAFTPRSGITTPVTGAAGASGGTSTTSAIPLNQLQNIRTQDFSAANLPGAQFEAMLTDSSTRVLQAPQVRASNNTKASINIGDKIPIATGSFQSAVGAVGALPAANTQFSFQDVGVNVEITPIVHENNEITMIVTLDVSAVKDRIDVGGVSQPEITQNKLTSDIRLREGEVNLIGGLIRDTNSKSLTGLPGLAHIPLFGRFFSNENVEKDKEELVIALVPHIVRGVDITASNLKGVASGSEGQYKVSYDTTRLPAPAAPAAVPQAQPQPAPGAPATPNQSNAQSPAFVPSAPAAPVVASATPPPATAPPIGTAPLGVPGMGLQPMAAPPRPAPGTGPKVTLQPLTSTAPLGGLITMTIYAENVTNLSDVSAQMQFDPKILNVANIAAGDLPGRGMSAAAEPVRSIQNNAGRADMRLSRGPSNGTSSGSGALFTVSFQVVGRGSTQVSLSSLAMGSPAGPVAASTPQAAVVTVP